MNDRDDRLIAVPASISNLGPGFDALSVAVRLYLQARIVDVLPSAPDTIEFDYGGVVIPGDNRIERAFRHARESVGIQAPGLRVEVRSDIPMRAGIGSSAAAAVAGLLLYERVTVPQPREEWLRMAAAIEGHPDNAAAALLGGLTVSCQHDDGTVSAISTAWPADVHLVVATPHLEVETGHARTVLPTSIPRPDAVFNLQRALLLVKALESGRYEHLREAVRDRWHQPYRAMLVPGLAEALELRHPALLGTCLSGSGPSIVAFAAGAERDVVDLLEGLYVRIGVNCTIRCVDAHQPNPVALNRDTTTV